MPVPWPHLSGPPSLGLGEGQGIGSLKLILTQIAPGLYFEKYWTKGWKINLIFKIALIDKMLFLFKVKHKPLSSCT